MADGIIGVLSAGTKIEYATTEGGAYTELVGVESIPEIGGRPETVDTTTLSNLTSQSGINGLQPVTELDYVFVMEPVAVDANYELAKALEDSGSIYFWKVTTSAGLVIEYKSDVTISYPEIAVNDKITFTMHHTAVDGYTANRASVSV
jgi:hypothetical protein